MSSARPQTANVAAGTDEEISAQHTAASQTSARESAARSASDSAPSADATPVADAAMRNGYGLTQTNWAEYFAQIGERPFRTQQLMKWLYHRDVKDFDAMTDMGRALRQRLSTDFYLKEPEVVTAEISTDGTRKWVVQAEHGGAVEMVLIPERGRQTLCVSSQVGCALDCSFCATGKQGFAGNLSTAEIVGQVLIADREIRGETGARGVTNVVMMGMGEPLLNFDQVAPAIDLMMDDLGFGISKRRVTVSTAGVVPGIYRLRAISDVSLAVSLHAPTDELRNELVPINRKYPIAELLQACRDYLDGLGEKRSITIEYTLIDGVNDSLQQARELDELLRGFRCKINLIPFNPYPGSPYRRPSAKRVHAFQTHLIARGHSAMMRTTRGDDIAAACGQLVGAVVDRTRRQARYRAAGEAVPVTVQPLPVAEQAGQS